MKKIIVLFVGLFSVSSFAQNFELGKVSIDELKEKIHLADSSASAAVLYKTGKNYFELNSEGYFILVSEIEQRVKIYKKEGYEYATVEVPYYTGGKLVRLYFDKAVTYNLVGDKIEKTKLKSDGEFTEKVNENYSIKKIALPNVKEGSVIEYKYTLKTPYYMAFPDFNFQTSIPVNKVQLTVEIPQYFTYRRFLKGYAPINMEAETVVKNRVNNYNDSRIVFKGEEIKALKEESHVNNIDNYTSILQYELAATNFPNSVVENFSTDWESVAKTIYDDKNFGNELNYKSYFEKDLDPLLKSTLKREDRINLIFNYVKSRMNWNEKNSYYCNVGVKKAYNEKVGNVAEINLMLTAMLRYANIKANPVLVSTQANGIAYYPNRTAYNYVICAIEQENGEYILLDATSKNSLPDILPLRNLNWVGRMIRENKTSKEIDLMPKMISRELINVMAQIDAEGKITGKARDQYFDYNACAFRDYYLKMSRDSYLEMIEKRYNGVEIGEYTTNNDKDLEKPMIETYDFTHTNMVERIGGKIYFSPMLYFAKVENPFKQEKREFPVDFPFPYQDKYTFSITIPDGYEIESLPKALSVVMEENLGSFKFNISSVGKTIQVMATIDVNSSHFSPNYYPTLKDFYKAMIEKQNEKVVLKKV
ncbi:DUF3858 domain-containing protein [Flavobacterium macacae]|uniref:DUF3857 domain-containing protein n=1 Tax=Flavobacterium macacae TaxID=2488993 RepID=A0A3P3WF02_9FLAO|nr:DUF3858 domain-containing protein [Flavobacterium macacae]RRJ91133.1 DUF3857 domain-containing protein [Flavobacterium macacae]